jgi:hypothetical protein
MKRPPHRKKSAASRQKDAESAPFTRQDKLKLWALFGGVALACFLAFHFLTTAQQRSSLDDLLVRWKSDYHLSDEQARTIRKMEEDFHGSGDPFFRPAPTAAETTEHHRQMAAQMSPEDGARFFAVMEGKPRKPTPRP